MFNKLVLISNSRTIREASSGEAGETIPAKVNVNTSSSDKVVITLPNSTVTLNGGTYSTVESTTAGETLIVSDGVTITNLQVKAGNVRIMNGGKVNSITNQTGGKIYVDIEDGGILATNPTDETIEVRQSISTAEGLMAFAQAVNGGNTYAGKTVVLNADIDLQNELWEPIGQTGGGRTSFQGIFDGKGFTIKNLKVDTSAETGEYFASGLFGWLEAHNSSYNPIIKNLTVDGAEIKGHNYCGVIGGYIDGGSTFSLLNCTVKNAHVSAQYYDNDTDGNKAGALVGYAGPGCQNITNCHAIDCTVDAVRDAGQLIGCTYTNKTTITNCTATNVTVSNNSTAPEDYAKNNQNIQEDIVGRPLILQQQ